VWSFARGYPRALTTFSVRLQPRLLHTDRSFPVGSLITGFTPWQLFYEMLFRDVTVWFGNQKAIFESLHSIKWPSSKLLNVTRKRAKIARLDRVDEGGDSDCQCVCKRSGYSWPRTAHRQHKRRQVHGEGATKTLAHHRSCFSLCDNNNVGNVGARPP
jgi:hypothetical protein